jgi:hypothetical protein
MTRVYYFVIKLQWKEVVLLHKAYQQLIHILAKIHQGCVMGYWARWARQSPARLAVIRRSLT